jgi:hypothetical protein
MSGSDYDLWIRVYSYTQKMAARAYPYDPEAAADLASDCFDIYVRRHAGEGIVNYQPWIGRSIAGLKKSRERSLRRAMSVDDENLPIDTLANLSPQQEPFYDAQVVRKLSSKLPERERWVFEIIADGGNVKDVMEELHVGPREALALLHQVRIKLVDYSTPRRRAA